MKSFKDFKTESYSVLNENPLLNPQNIQKLQKAKQIAGQVFNKGITYGTVNTVYDVAKPKDLKTNQVWKHALSTAATFPKATLNVGMKAVKFGGAVASTLLGMNKFKQKNEIIQ